MIKTIDTLRRIGEPVVLRTEDDWLDYVETLRCGEVWDDEKDSKAADAIKWPCIVVSYQSGNDMFWTHSVLSIVDIWTALEDIRQLGAYEHIPNFAEALPGMNTKQLREALTQRVLDVTSEVLGNAKKAVLSTLRDDLAS